MCGRFTLRTPINLLAERFMVETSLLDVRPRYNIAPTQDAFIVRAHDGKREAAMLRCSPEFTTPPGRDQCRSVS